MHQFSINMNEITEKIEKFISLTEENKSSYWKHHLKKENAYKIPSGRGIDSIPKKNIL